MAKLTRDLLPVELTEVQTALRLAAIHYRKLDGGNTEMWNTWAQRCRDIANELDNCHTLTVVTYDGKG